MITTETKKEVAGHRPPELAQRENVVPDLI